jgi:T5orf172 domain-containing protein
MKAVGLSRRSLNNNNNNKKKEDEDTESSEIVSVAPRRSSLVNVKMPPLDIPAPTKQSDDEGSGSSSSGRRRRLLVLTRSPTPVESPKKVVFSPRMKLSLDPKTPVNGVVNHKSVVKDIEARVRRGPSGADRHGFIYMYEYEHDADPRYRKIGRSERLPAKRCAEWPGSKLIKSWRCRRDRFAEVLIHWLLDAVRVCRYVMGVNEAFGFEVLISKRKTDKQYIHDTVFKKFEGEKLSTDTTGKTRHQEWFLVDQDVLMKVIDAVVSDVNMHWADEPWSALMEQMK